MAYFEDRDHFHRTIEKEFSTVECFIVTEEWPKNPLQAWCAKCEKGE